MISFFGYSPSAQRFALSHTPTGRGGGQIPITPVFADAEVREIVGRPFAFLAGVSLERYELLRKFSGAEHDDPSALAITRVAEVDGGPTGLIPFGEALSSRLESRRVSYMNQAWQSLRDGDLIRGRSAFGTASMLDDGLLAPRVGEFLVDVAEGRFRTAAVRLEAIFRRDADPFEAHYHLADVFPDSSGLSDWAMAVAASRADAAIEDGGPLAVYAYLLWLDGQQDMALAIADQIHRDYRDSPYSSMAEKMREHLEVKGS